MHPLVSVIIPFYNCSYVHQAIQSVLQQTYPNIEIIVVDDGSTQHADLILPFKNKVHYLGKKNGGTASALNHGIRMASGTYMAWLSSDDMFYPQKIQNQLSFMLRNDSLVSYTPYDAMDANSHIYQRNIGHVMPGEIALCQGFIKGLNPINGCTIMVQRSVFDISGYFNEQLRFTQDYDMWVRLMLHGVKFDYVPEPLTMYRFHERMGTVRHQSEMFSEYEAVQRQYAKALTYRIRQLEESSF
ncbi:glycosyl transferase family 2 [Paenibacillus marchantiophytorum]|uniref:Glycosyl transferase family 2 n=1 Tax=Paenibacillus marchantiophytorum TaxID=1619310 RepID=A0ABQ1FBW4_9BACL|nr:glycosyltransferase [Paenibacillus marchantiophytorum]GGA05413.1 glycosyl transferase family 2 [Paenibacillus marchantiophytorum]